MFNAIQNYVRTGSIISNDGSGPIEKTAGRGHTFCHNPNCQLPTGSKSLRCRHCGDVRVSKTRIPRFTYNPRKPRKVNPVRIHNNTNLDQLATLLFLLAKGDKTLAKFLAS